MGAVVTSHARIAVSVLLHAKWLRAPELARYLWLAAIVYANGQPQIGGRIPWDVVNELLRGVAAGRYRRSDGSGATRPITVLEVVEQAIGARMFDPLEETPDGPVLPIHDYTDWNETPAQRDDLTEKRRAAGRAGGLATAAAHQPVRDPDTGKVLGTVPKQRGDVASVAPRHPASASASARSAASASVSPKPTSSSTSSTASTSPRDARAMDGRSDERPRSIGQDPEAVRIMRLRAILADRTAGSEEHEAAAAELVAMGTKP
jgi:hypothetical protein